VIPEIQDSVLLEGEIRMRDTFTMWLMVDTEKKLIHSLVQEEGLIEGHEQLKSYITFYYKGLFGALEEYAPWRNMMYPWTNPELTIYPKCLQKKTLF
jgi:hypothetical protein